MDAVTKRNDKYCKGCRHWRNICPSSKGTDHMTLPVCHYLIDTGHARMLDCPAGKGCVHYKEKGDDEDAEIH